MPRRRYKQPKPKRRFNGVKVFLIVLLVALLASVGAAYANVAPFVNAKEAVLVFLEHQWQKQNISSQFDTKLTDIGFRSSGIIYGDVLSISGDKLMFRVDVIPKDSFTGEPFNTVELGNKDIGFKTFVQSTPWVYVILLSRDGHYFSSHGPLIWTPEELQLPDESERDYYKTQSMMKRRIKSVTLSAPSSDKAVVALLQDSNELTRELQKKQWKWLIGGEWLLGEDLPKESDEEYIRSKFEELFNRHFKLVVVEKEQWLKFESLD